MIKKIVLFIFCIPLTMHAVQMTQQEREAIVTKLDELTQQRLVSAQALKQKFTDLNNSEITVDKMQTEAHQIKDILKHITNLSDTIEESLRSYINPQANYKDKLDEAGLLKRLDETIPLDEKVFNLINQSNQQADSYADTVNELVQQILAKAAQAAEQEQSALSHEGFQGDGAPLSQLQHNNE